MKIEVENFINYIKNYTLPRAVDENVLEQEQELINKWYKNRLNECYSYLRILNSHPDNLSLKEEIKEITKLTHEVENSFIKWKGINVSNNN